MFISLRKDCFFRKYGNVGYLVKPASSCDKVVNDSGAIFCEQLSKEPESLDKIATKIRDKYYQGVDLEELKDDALNFFQELANDNFVAISKSKDDLIFSQGFHYSTLLGKQAFLKETNRLDESSQVFLGKYFQQNPCLETFHIEITSKCNERCIHCYIPHHNKILDINRDLVKKAFKQSRDMNVLSIIFSGGEPMLHPNFIEFLKAAKDYDFSVTCLTNLTLLTDEILNALKYKNDSILNVSLYSMDANVHDSITCLNGSFEKTKNNILKLIENNIPVQINCPVMKQNRDSFYKVVEWGESLKCFVNVDMQLMARYDHTNDNLDNALEENDYKIAIENFLKSSVVYKSNALKKIALPELEKILPKPEDKVCGVGFSTLCMTATGDIYPCAGWQGYKCGNLNETTLQDIWINSKTINKLRSIKNKDFTKCRNCEDSNFCRMCMAHNYNDSKNESVFDIPKSTCVAARVEREIIEDFRKRNLDQS